MGAKAKYIIIMLLTAQMALKAQSRLDYGYVDSVTYSCYLTGNWDKVIALGSEALNQNIDYKYLRQRIGYAYYSKGDFIKSQKHFSFSLPLNLRGFECNRY